MNQFVGFVARNDSTIEHCKPYARNALRAYNPQILKSSNPQILEPLNP